MFKITKIEQNDRTINLRMDGKLIEGWPSEFEKLYVKIKNEDYTRIIIDFAGVSFIDDDAIGFIEKIKDDRVDIINCSPFIELLLGDLVIKDTAKK